MAKSRNAVFAEEKAEVEVLHAQAAKHGEMGRKLAALQARLQGGGRNVQDSIGPIHNNTREHQTVGSSMLPPHASLIKSDSADIDKILTYTDHMLEPGQDKGKEERIIRSGSESPRIVDLPTRLT